MDAARCIGRRISRTLALGRVLWVVCGFVLALTVAAPAWASLGAAGSYAPDGAGGYVVTLKNTGTEAITAFTVETFPVDRAHDLQTRLDLGDHAPMRSHR
jgi:hypothetical protein